MNVKRLSAILIAITFCIVVLISLVELFSIKKVEAQFFVVSENVESAQSVLDGYEGKNLLFLDEKDVENALSSNPYLQIYSVEKRYPNVLKLSVKERREVYRLTDNGKTYILDQDGYVLNDNGVSKQGGALIDLSFITFRNNPNLTSKINVKSGVLGLKIQTDNDYIVYKSLAIAKNIGLFDCINAVVIEDCAGEYDVTFVTNTAVKIYVVDLAIDGERKGQVAFDVYNTTATDYQKRFGNIEVCYLKDGQDKLRVIHTYDDIDKDDRVDVTLYEEQI